jgi:hypothetical protein
LIWLDRASEIRRKRLSPTNAPHDHDDLACDADARAAATLVQANSLKSFEPAQDFPANCPRPSRHSNTCRIFSIFAAAINPAVAEQKT